ncbi:MAG: hypothetical protein KKG06_12355 [Bacteroidetes bacterium]|nr:hypothetical protein [Bacteroidota bacterium]MBU1423947.1 hypothetical protein [Bacteroidota bacterium]
MEFGCSFYLGALVVFIVFATIKCWVRWKGGSPIASLTAFHDFQPKDKQEAIEIVIEQKAGKKWEEQESGKNIGEEKNLKSQISNLKSNKG